MNEKLGKKLNIMRWNKKLTEILLLHYVTCYKERCTIIAAESQSAYEKHTREKAIELHNDIRTNITANEIRIIIAQISSVCRNYHMFFLIYALTLTFGDIYAIIMRISFAVYMEITIG